MRKPSRTVMIRLAKSHIWNETTLLILSLLNLVVTNHGLYHKRK